ncbi:MAG TPA: rRNA maturation RNase YbeY [Spirochaetota bacterium]|nr:rRNA maturation RNase YbeY [Spirochaetota bacterium]HPJ36516.1 rRNA maturation RNase YbeY [Spirochaetota bacterium]
MKTIEIFTEGNISLPYDNIDENYISRISGKILELTATDNVSISIILTDNEYIHEINSEYRGKDMPTDVISFAYRDEPFPSPSGITEELGDVYISLERTAEQSVEFKVTFEEELKRLITHGILHLLGYDHEKSPEDELRMRELEEKILSSLK